MDTSFARLASLLKSTGTITAAAFVQTDGDMISWDVAIVTEEQTSGTHATSASSSGGWNTRRLNKLSLRSAASGLVALVNGGTANAALRLAAGTYSISANAVAYQVTPAIDWKNTFLSLQRNIVWHKFTTRLLSGRCPSTASRHSKRTFDLRRRNLISVRNKLVYVRVQYLAQKSYPE